MTRTQRALEIHEYTLNTWESAFTIFAEGESIHGTKAVERAIRIMNAIDPEFTQSLINNEVSATQEETNTNTITMYHGTHETNLTFTDNRTIKNYNHIGTWFTSSKENAKTFYGKNVVTANVKLNNPLYVNYSKPEDFDSIFIDTNLMKQYKVTTDKVWNNGAYIEALKTKYIANGYDAIVFENSSIDCEPNDNKHNVYIILNANNIKVVAE